MVTLLRPKHSNSCAQASRLMKATILWAMLPAGHRAWASLSRNSVKMGKAGFRTHLALKVDMSVGLGITQSRNLGADALLLTQAQREPLLAGREAELTGRQSLVITLACDAHLSRYHNVF